MPKWILGRTLTLIGILGAPFSAAQAQSLETGSFATESEARDYLRRFPTGPRANAAFLALSEFRLTEDNPGLTRDQIISGFGYQGAPQTTQVRQSTSANNKTPGAPSTSTPGTPSDNAPDNPNTNAPGTSNPPDPDPY